MPTIKKDFQVLQNILQRNVGVSVFTTFYSLVFAVKLEHYFFLEEEWKENFIPNSHGCHHGSKTFAYFNPIFVERA